jgi:hypothetical protein
VLSANNASLRRSAGSREDLRIVRAAESKYEEVVRGLDASLSGELDGLPGWRWVAFRAKTYVAELKKLKRLQFMVYRPDNSKAFEWGGLREDE